MVAAAIGGAALVGAVATGVASSNAADAQKHAADTASATQRDMFNSVRSDLAPFTTYGQGAAGLLSGRLADSDLLQPFGETAPTFAPPTDEASLAATPGYQFTLNQGLKGVRNTASARGLGLSGAQLKAAAGYTTGLADSTYGQQFGRALDTYNANLQGYNTRFNAFQTQQQNTYNKLLGVAQLGENAAAQTGSMGTQTAGQIGNNLIGAGNASAAASMATGNAISGGVNNIAQYYALKSIIGAGGGASGQAGVFATQG